MNTVERFSNRVENYVKYRPDYPREIIGYLADEIGLAADWIIADIGCGTGISSRMFLENGNSVIGVEPNDTMRRAAVDCLADFSEFTAIDGTSDATNLPDASVDLIVAAQAFHWFDAAATKSEFQRIAKPGGYAVLMWNERSLDATPFLVEYEEFLKKYSTDYESVRHDRLDEKVLADFFAGPIKKQTFENFQLFDFDGIKGRVLSASYMPSEADDAYTAMIDELQTIFAKHAQNGIIKVFYDTNLYSSST